MQMGGAEISACPAAITSGMRSARRGELALALGTRRNPTRLALVRCAGKSEGSEGSQKRKGEGASERQGEGCSPCPASRAAALRALRLLRKARSPPWRRRRSSSYTFCIDGILVTLWCASSVERLSGKRL